MLSIQKELELQTGDLLLFRGSSWLSLLLEYAGQSKYSHVGMILKNPRFIHESLEDGLYLWDASYSYTPEVENHDIRYGVQIHKLDDILPLYKDHSIYVRKVTADRNQAFEQQIKSIHEEVHAKPYNLNIMDWIAAALHINHSFSWWKQTHRFWCSSLIAFIYHRLGWISEVNWSLVAPREFSSTESSGTFLFTIVISDEEML
jgi:cell wall-associated NlpC family hydrolase